MGVSQLILELVSTLPAPSRRAPTRCSSSTARPGSTSGSDLAGVPVSVGGGDSARGGREGHGGHVALWGRDVRDIVPMHREERDDLSMQPYLSMQPVPSSVPSVLCGRQPVSTGGGSPAGRADVMDSEGSMEDLEVMVNYLDN